MSLEGKAIEAIKEAISFLLVTCHLSHFSNVGLAPEVIDEKYFPRASNLHYKNDGKWKENKRIKWWKDEINLAAIN